MAVVRVQDDSADWVVLVQGPVRLKIGKIETTRTGVQVTAPDGEYKTYQKDDQIESSLGWLLGRYKSTEKVFQ